MKITERSGLSKKIKKDSYTQLMEDFESYPPAPIKGVIPPHEFNIHILSPKFFLANKLYSFSFFLAKGNRRFLENFPSEIAETIENVDRSFAELKAMFINMNIAGKILFFTLTLTLSPFILMWSIFLILKILIRHRKKLDGVRGFFSPSPDSNGISNKLVIDKSLLKQDVNEFHAVVSHEHIHYLQSLSTHYQDRERHSAFPLKKPELLISSKHLLDSHISEYLFSEKEVEARLHEAVVAYYRKHERLPVTVTGFAELLFENINISAPWVDNEKLNNAKNRFIKTKLSKKSLHESRSSKIDLDFFIMSKSIKDSESGIRYLYEVLPVFYSRLLQYYGGVQEADMISDQIIRPNFYDRLYG